MRYYIEGHKTYYFNTVVEADSEEEAISYVKELAAKDEIEGPMDQEVHIDGAVSEVEAGDTLYGPGI